MTRNAVFRNRGDLLPGYHVNDAKRVISLVRHQQHAGGSVCGRNPTERPRRKEHGDTKRFNKTAKCGRKGKHTAKVHRFVRKVKRQEPSEAPSLELLWFTGHGGLISLARRQQ